METRIAKTIAARINEIADISKTKINVTLIDKGIDGTSALINNINDGYHTYDMSIIAFEENNNMRIIEARKYR